MQEFRLFIAFSILALSTACTTPLVVLKPNCSEINWFERGRQDGMQGQPSNNWTMTARECAQMSGLEIQKYTDGWNHGLSMFCTENHGFLAAKAGDAYTKTCPEKYEEDFMRGYKRGLQVFLIEKETTQIISKLEGMEKELKKPTATETDKAVIKKEIDDLNQRKQVNLQTLEQFNNSLSR